MGLQVAAYQCPTCKDIVYSRARHDMRGCTCGAIAVDGGFDYSKISFKFVPPSPVPFEVDATKKDLYDDWNNYGTKYGLVRAQNVDASSANQGANEKEKEPT
jgi:hypothetical protein